MEKAPDLTIYSMIFCFLLLVIPFVILLYFRLSIIKSMFISVIRMTIQLFLAGLYLEYLFKWDNSIINLAWLFVMLFAASFSSIKNSELDLKRFILPAFSAFSIATLGIVLYFNYFIIRLENVLEAKYLVVIGGMLLGNSLRGNIIGLSSFYLNIKRNQTRFQYHLALGASQFEALLPYLKTALVSAVNPTIATMMTIGIVSLPGMMTGQMLGGSNPLVAIKYQIAIMIAIFVSVMVSVVLVILFSLKTVFNGFGILKQTIFSKQ